MEGKIISFPYQRKAKRIHLHQTRIARDAKGTALRRWAGVGWGGGHRYKGEKLQ